MGGGPVPTEEQVKEKIFNILSCFDKIDPAKLTVDAKFIDDMGLDSLDVVECVMAIEDEFNMELSDAQAEVITSPADLLPYILKH